MEHGYTIKSKPVYTALHWYEKATSHLLLAQGAGGQSLVNLLQQTLPNQPISVLYLQETAADAEHARKIKAVLSADGHVFTSMQQLQNALKLMLPYMHMGTRFYVAGAEGFIWSITTELKPFGVVPADIMQEQTGTLARTVYCVHCKAITTNVTTNVTPCAGCGSMLFVRDHFSRNMGAYMGLMVDAEEPGELPEIEEIYR
jgi:ferredoxin-NADP reductase